MDRNTFVARLARLPRADALESLTDVDPRRDDDTDRAAGALLGHFRQHDDTETFTLLYELCASRLFPIARRIARQHAVAVEAEDLVSAFMVRLFTDPAKDAPPVRHFLGLASVAMRNEALNQLRRARRAATRHEVYETRRHLDPPVDPARQADWAERTDDLARLGALFVSIAGECFNRLPERDRRILVAREVDGLSYDDLATTLELPRPQVGMILKRARQHLADGIADAFALSPERLAASERLAAAEGLAAAEPGPADDDPRGATP